MGHYLWQCNLAANDVAKLTAYDRNNFWIQVFEGWCRFYYQDNVEPDKACYQIIWCNSHIRIGGKPILWESVMRVGVNTINNLLDVNLEIMTYDDFCDQYGMCITWLDYSLLSAIPTEWLPWLLSISNSQAHPKTNLDKLRLRKTSKTSVVYNTLADLGGGHARRTPSPMGPNSFVFAYIFTEKHPHRRSTPPNGCTPPYRNSWIHHCNKLISNPIRLNTLCNYWSYKL